MGVHSPGFCGGGFAGRFEFSPGDARTTVCLSLTLTPSSTFRAVSVVTFLRGCLGWVVVVVVGVCIYLLFPGPRFSGATGVRGSGKHSPFFLPSQVGAFGGAQRKSTGNTGLSLLGSQAACLWDRDVHQVPSSPETEDPQRVREGRARRSLLLLPSIL